MRGLRGEQDWRRNVRQVTAVKLDQPERLDRVPSKGGLDNRRIDAANLRKARRKVQHDIYRKVQKPPGVKVQQACPVPVKQQHARVAGRGEIGFRAQGFREGNGRVLGIAGRPGAFGIGHRAVAGDVSPGLDRAVRDLFRAGQRITQHPA